MVQFLLDNISDREWNFVVGKDAKIFEKLYSLDSKLGDIADIFVGLQTSADKVFILDLIEEKSDCLKLKSKALNEEWEFEKRVFYFRWLVEPMLIDINSFHHANTYYSHIWLTAILLN